MIAEDCQTLQPLVDIEEPGCPRIDSSLAPPNIRTQKSNHGARFLEPSICIAGRLCGDHEVANDFAFEALGCRDMRERLTVVAIECKGDADLFAVVASQLETVRTPAQVRALDGDLAAVATLLGAGTVAQQQAVRLHDAIRACG
jgi:hypothetical protein